MPVLLVIDDEPAILQLFRRVFEKHQVSVVTAATGADGLRLLDEVRADAAVLDVQLPDLSGLELFRLVRQRDAKLPVVFITASAASDTAIEAMQHGALDYFVKPLDFAEVRPVIERAFEIRRLMLEPVQVRPAAGAGSASGEMLVGRCPAMQEVYKAIGRVAAQNVTVLIRGESGTGKELVARALYHHSHRRGGPFMAVNCAAIPEALLESELFGHERGSFTGADRKRIGKFEQCSGGTLFLDEIGDMTPALQSKMLRVLQEQRFERVGGNETIATDVRVIAATNRDLERMVADGHFRSDLFYRLNGYTIKLPPLRQRGDDLLLLVDYFLDRANRDLGREVRGVSAEAVERLRRHPWTGNVRELQSAIRQAVLQTTGPVLLADFLPEAIRNATLAAKPADSTSAAAYWNRFLDERLSGKAQNLYDQALVQMEVELLTRVLQHTAGNQVEAARLLGITRTTLRTKIRQLGIAIQRVVRPQDEEDEEEAPAD